jgi:hypothetical protein
MILNNHEKNIDKLEAIKPFMNEGKSVEDRQVYPTEDTLEKEIQHTKENRLRAAKAASR